MTLGPVAGPATSRVAEWSFARAGLVTVAAGLLCAGCHAGPKPETFVKDAWPSYKDRYLDSAGYVLDRRRSGGMVTSEGQGYAMLRAVWERDPDAFSRVAAWTRAHLLRADGLHAWLWSPASDGVADPASATDGDLEIAWALLLGSDVFGRPELRAEARNVLRAVRAHSAVSVPGGWFPAAGDWAVADRIVNLSYFVPYAHPWFATADPEGGWSEVTRVGYDLLAADLATPGRILPSTFVALDPDGFPGALQDGSQLEQEFSFDAVRIFWRVEADCRLTARPRACADPLDVPRAARLLVRDGRIVTRYGRDGAPLADDESLSFYGALWPAFHRYVPESADAVLRPRLEGRSLQGMTSAADRYYDENWVWFGLALESGLIESRTPAPPDF